MNYSNLTNKRAAFYLMISKYFKSTIMFGSFVGIFVAAMFAYGVLMNNSYADPLFSETFGWADFATPLVVTTATLSLVYTLISTAVHMLTKKVIVARDGVEIESGVVQKKVEFIPYTQIKYVEHKQTLLQRAMKFASLSIDYGGWNPETIELISEDKAQQLQTKLAGQATVAQLGSV